MGFTNWFASGLKKNKQVHVKRIKEESVDMGVMAAGSLTAGADILGRMIDQRNAPTKVLMVQDGEYLPQVTDYALKMAQRLDCEIIALDVTDKPLQFTGDRRTREVDRFMEMARVNAAKFIIQAVDCGIKVEHMIAVRDPKEAIARVSAKDAGIRYVLSKPGEEAVRTAQRHPHVPAFDLHCSRL